MTRCWAECVWGLFAEIVPLEKCYLNPNFDDIFCDNRMGYNYFNNFLETKMTATEIFHLWSEISTSSDYFTNKSAKGEDSVVSESHPTSMKIDAHLDNCDSGSETNTSLLVPFVNEKFGKLSDHWRNKTASLVANKSNADELPDACLDSLQPVTIDILHE